MVAYMDFDLPLQEQLRKGDEQRAIRRTSFPYFLNLQILPAHSPMSFDFTRVPRARYTTALK